MSDTVMFWLFASVAIVFGLAVIAVIGRAILDDKQESALREIDHRWAEHNHRARLSGCARGCGRAATVIALKTPTAGNIPHELWTCGRAECGPTDQERGLVSPNDAGPKWID